MFGTAPGQKRGYCGHQEIELALIKLYARHARQEAPRPRRLFHRRARPPAAALFRRRGRGARRRPGEILVPHLRIQPVAQAGARAGQSHRPCGARDVHVFGDGRSRRRTRRRGAQARLRDAVARCHLEAHVRHRRPRPLRLERRLHQRLRPAERHRVCRDLRVGGADLLGAAHAQPRLRRRLCRRDGARAVQRRALRPVARGHALLLRQLRWKATAATPAGNGTRARAAR